MITQKLKRAVVKEALLLRKHATKKEKDKLDYYWLKSRDPSGCVYGQMTGNCWSERAAQLIKKCAVAYTISLNAYNSPKSKKITRGCVFGCDHSPDTFTAIEYYISQPNAKIETLINLIKS